MNPVEHQLYLYSPTGELLTVIQDGAWIDLSYGLRENEAGVLELTLPGDFPRDLLKIDSLIEVYRSYGGGLPSREGDTAFFIRKPVYFTGADKTRAIHVTAYSAFGLLKRRVIPYFAGTSYTDKYNEHWDDMVKEIMRENYGSLATDTARNLSPWLTIESDVHYGVSYTRSMAWGKIYNTITDIIDDIRSQGVYSAFDVVRTGAGTFEFRIFLGARGNDHSAGTASQVIVSEERGNLTVPSFTDDWEEEHNFIYATGQDTGINRTVKTAQDDTRIGISPFNRQEFIQDARADILDESVQAEANSSLEAGRPKRFFTGKILQTEGCIYGLHWGWGDIITAEYERRSYTCHVDSVTVNISPNGTELVEGKLRSVQDAG